MGIRKRNIRISIITLFDGTVQNPVPVATQWLHDQKSNTKEKSLLSVK